MFIQSHSGGNGLGYGFGATGLTLTQGKDFNCKGSSCYAIGADRQRQFETLQTQLNVFATPVGFAPIRVDGLIGPTTVTAAQLVAKAIRSSELPGADLPVVTAVSNGTTAQQLAANVTDFNLALATVGPLITALRLREGLPTTPINPTPRPAGPPGAVPGPGSGMAPDVFTSYVPPKSKTFWWIMGGLAVVSVVGGVGYVVYRRKGRS